ncbi:DUF1203 domain-containing protein [Novosphingobium piscinae]|uniref:DUF1203 domain-containing protein n=1 Tax=Novosphingobium piscinae TaxID=1507448 RepID=A0A7X1FX74_9SPHN|nr:DUF1203 domain-containing protein [Novosphingobium piscinae]MBC2668660.1 DUF1203 domain-containing protein [Novosphingobium piscinae]
MTYIVTGLAADLFADLPDLDDAALAQRGISRVTATANRGFPCRITLEDARQGEELLLLNHVTHPVAGPYRFAYAIYVRVAAIRAGGAPARHVAVPPPVFAGRHLALRGFADDGTLREARLAAPGEADPAIRALFADPAIAYIHAHNAAPGCFAARVDREEPRL